MIETVQPKNPTSTTLPEFLTALREKVITERDAKRDGAKNTLLTKSSRELIYRDELAFIPGVEISRSTVTGPNILTVDVPVNPRTGKSPDIRSDYGIFVGNEVLLQGGYEGEEVHATGLVDKISKKSIDVKIGGRAEDDLAAQAELSKSTNSSIGLILNPVTYDRQLEAISAAENHPIKHFLTGAEPLEFSHQIVANTPKFDRSLYQNDRQAEGIEKALYAERLACLQGPPGTGKTRVIVELVRRLVTANQRVLVAAETNAAVDNIVVGTSDELRATEGSLLHLQSMEDFDVARTNLDGENVHPLAKKELSSNSVKASPIVASTNNSAADLEKEAFDYVVIDEATQASIPSTLIPLTRGQKIILVGDHKQLPPFSELQNQTSTSLFEHLYAENGVYGPDIGTRFDVQYRMHKKIAQFPSSEFYDGDLKTAPSAGQMRRSHGMLPMGIFEINGNNEKGEISKSNESEANFVEKQVRMLIQEKGLRGSEVGVAAAYREQAERIKTRLEDSSITGIQDLKVDTFDSFQGSERDAMILSFTRSNNEGDIGFLGHEIGRRRLNVAMTRAKGFCSLVGDWDTLREGSELYDRLYHHVKSKIAPPKRVC